MPPAAAAVAPEVLGSIGGAGGGAGGAAAGAAGKSGMLSGLLNKPMDMAKSGLGLATSFIQNISANKAKRKADSLMPGLVDPRQAAFLAELNQKRKALDTGADFGVGMNQINGTQASANDAITKSTGGDVGATIQGLLSSERTADDGKNNIIAQGQGQQMQYNSMFNDLNNKISARSMQLQLLKSQQARAEWAQKKQSANQNFQAGVGGLLSGLSPSAKAPEIPAASGQSRFMNSGEFNISPDTLGDPANAPDLGKGGVNPELMGNAANGKLNTSFLNNFNGK